jgi:DNA polymerase I
MLADALNSNLNLQRNKILYISGNYFRILTRMDRRFTSLEVRRAFTSFQLMTILEEARHSLILVEHCPPARTSSGPTILTKNLIFRAVSFG